MPYSTSVPITRRTLTTSVTISAYGAGAEGLVRRARFACQPLAEVDGVRGTGVVAEPSHVLVAGRAVERDRVELRLAGHEQRPVRPLRGRGRLQMRQHRPRVAAPTSAFDHVHALDLDRPLPRRPVRLGVEPPPAADRDRLLAVVRDEERTVRGGELAGLDRGTVRLAV